MDWFDVDHKLAHVRRLAEEFLRLYSRERGGQPESRLAEVHAEIDRTGTYRHTGEELEFGAKVAWRNSNRCIGRLYWNSLTVRDRRHLSEAEEIAEESFEHLRVATNDGRIRPTITIFAPAGPHHRGPHIWNEQLIRYAGYQRTDGTVLGDPRTIGITSAIRALGWPGGPGNPFDVLPLVVQGRDGVPHWFTVPADAVLEVTISHPELPWFAELGLRWYAVPAISNMCLEIGGICYGAAPFNGWYMGTEIGARNFADSDRYDMLPKVARCLGLDTTRDRSLWKDRALVELNLAVLHSFDAAGITLSDHHTESIRFLSHIAREERAGRRVGADWSWIVPPLSGGATAVFHRYYDTDEQRPTFALHPEAEELSRGAGVADPAANGHRAPTASRCPHG